MNSGHRPFLRMIFKAWGFFDVQNRLILVPGSVPHWFVGDVIGHRPISPTLDPLLDLDLPHDSYPPRATLDLHSAS